MDDNRFIFAVAQFAASGQRFLQIQCADQVNLIQIRFRLCNISCRTLQRILAESDRFGVGCDNVEGVTVFSIVQQSTDDFDLSSRQQRIAVSGRFEKKDPVSRAAFRFSWQLRTVSQQQVLVPAVRGFAPLRT